MTELLFFQAFLPAGRLIIHEHDVSGIILKDFVVPLLMPAHVFKPGRAGQTVLVLIGCNELLSLVGSGEIFLKVAVVHDDLRYRIASHASSGMDAARYPTAVMNFSV